MQDGRPPVKLPCLRESILADGQKIRRGRPDGVGEVDSLGVGCEGTLNSGCNEVNVRWTSLSDSKLKQGLRGKEFNYLAYLCVILERIP
jgi:hypothetical protein